MTELQQTIRNLTQMIINGNLLLYNLERTQKDLEKPKIPKFSPRFLVKRDATYPKDFMIALHRPICWPELPSEYRGRTCFSKGDIKIIIKELQVLIGESNA